MPSPTPSPVETALRPTPATKDRVQRSLELRKQLAQDDSSHPASHQTPNGDEEHYADKSGTYSKGLKQTSVGLVDLAAYRSLKKALDSGKPADFNNIITGGGKGQNGPQGALAFALDCLDSSQFASPAAPALASEEYAAELVELYWASLLRDVPFTDYGANAIANEAASELSTMPTYAGPKVGGAVTTDVLFRGGFPGETDGPYVSQFVLQDTNMGALKIVQQYITNMAGTDFMKDKPSFFAAQNGNPTGSLTPGAAVYLHDGRSFAAYTHADVLYQAYFIAYLVLSSVNGANPPLNPGNPYIGATTQNGFGTFGGPDFASTLAAIAGEAIKAVWYQKWLVHLRHRPESGGGLVYLSNTPAEPQAQGKLNAKVLNSKAVQMSKSLNNSFFLSQAFPEGSPFHPAYPTGHGTVAGACITVLKFFFDGSFVFPKPVVPASNGASTNPYVGALTVNGELNKLAHNISFGHGILAGIHWRSDTDASIKLGEQVALSFLQDRAKTYNEKFRVKLQKVDGSTAEITNE
jgi:hypothetical protein